MDPDTGDILLSLTFLLLGGLIVFCENTIIDLPDSMLKKDDSSTKNQRSLQKLLESPRKFTSAMRVAYTLFQLCGAFFLSRFLFSFAMVQQLIATAATWKYLWFVVVVVITTFLSLVLSRGVPRRLAATCRTSIALFFVPVARSITILVAPLRALVDITVGGISAILGAEYKEGEDNITEEELRMLVDVSEETGGIEQTEREMINNIFEFDDRTAGEIMTHRTDMICVEKDATLQEIVELSKKKGYSRMPVVDEGIDDISGILCVKDLLPLMLDTKARNRFRVSRFKRPVLFIPESTRCHDLFAQLNAAKTQIAIVVDEYGGTSGLITMEDLLESIVGNIQDEYDNEIAEATAITTDSYTLDGDIDLEEVEHLFDCDLEEYIEEDYETLGGLMIGLLDRIPHMDEHPTVTIGGVEFTVEKANERQILTISARKQPPFAIDDFTETSE